MRAVFIVWLLQVQLLKPPHGRPPCQGVQKLEYVKDLWDWYRGLNLLFCSFVSKVLHEMEVHRRALPMSKEKRGPPVVFHCGKSSKSFTPKLSIFSSERFSEARVAEEDLLCEAQRRSRAWTSVRRCGSDERLKWVCRGERDQGGRSSDLHRIARYFNPPPC